MVGYILGIVVLALLLSAVACDQTLQFEGDASPADAERLGLHAGERVCVTSRQGAVEMPLRVDSRVKAGELFATFHTAEAALNRLTGQGRDTHAMTPEYKVVAVRVEKMEGENGHG